jgi:hypothetical protein
MNRNRQTVTIPILISTPNAKNADGWANFLTNDQVAKHGGFVHSVTAMEAKTWLRKDCTAAEFSICIAANKLLYAHENADEFTLMQAHDQLRVLVPDLASIEELSRTFKSKDGSEVSIKSQSQKWNATRWNYSRLVSQMFEKAQLVMWHSESNWRFLPALYCPDRNTASVVATLTKHLRICPKCDAIFIPAADNVDYCSPAHREAHRVARSRWRKQQAIKGNLQRKQQR